MRFELHNNEPTTEQMNFRPFQAFLRLLGKLNGKLSLEDRKELAGNPNTPPETLTILARDKVWDVRWRVAYNSNTPPETLTILARDEKWRVRYEVAENPNTPPEILTILARDKDGDVRLGVERNLNATREIVQTVRAYEFYKEQPTL